MKTLCLSVLMACLVLAGCSVLPSRSPAPAAHDLGLVKGMPASAPWRHVSVTEPDWLQNDGINYRIEYAAATRLRAYTLDRWVASPGELLSDRFNSVASPDGRFMVHLNLLAFEQVFTGPGKAHAYLRARVEADSVDGGHTYTKTFVLDTPTSQANAKGAVQGLAQLTSSLEHRLRVWLKTQPHRNAARAAHAG